MADTVFDEKRRQEYIYLQKVNPKCRDILRRRIIKYDLEHSPLIIIRDARGDYEKMITGLKDLVASRELYLNKIVNEINEL